MKKFEKIYEENIQHNSFLDKDSVMKSMMESYNLGKLELMEWLSKNDYLTDTKEQLLIEYNQHLKTIENDKRRIH
jgi:hypothetical protein